MCELPPPLSYHGAHSIYTHRLDENETNLEHAYVCFGMFLGVILDLECKLWVCACVCLRI